MDLIEWHCKCYYGSVNYDRKPSNWKIIACKYQFMNIFKETVNQ